MQMRNPTCTNPSRPSCKCRHVFAYIIAQSSVKWKDFICISKNVLVASLLGHQGKCPSPRWPGQNGWKVTYSSLWLLATQSLAQLFAEMRHCLQAQELCLGSKPWLSCGFLEMSAGCSEQLRLAWGTSSWLLDWWSSSPGRWGPGKESNSHQLECQVFQPQLLSTRSVRGAHSTGFSATLCDNA
jgi:hypothetical protein